MDSNPQSSSCQATDIVEKKVWDRFVRFFHWSLVLGIICAYFSASYHYMTVHLWVGYSLCGLITARIIWGFVGSHYALFRNFSFGPTVVGAYLISIIKNRPQHFLGHNPAGAVMVFALLGLVIILLVSGFIVLGVIDFEGPLWWISTRVADSTSYQIQSVHEWLGHYFWIIVAVHVVGVVVASFQHRENLVMAMLTGIKKVPATSCLEPTFRAGKK